MRRTSRSQATGDICIGRSILPARLSSSKISHGFSAITTNPGNVPLGSGQAELPSATAVHFIARLPRVKAVRAMAVSRNAHATIRSKC